MRVLVCCMAFALVSSARYPDESEEPEEAYGEETGSDTELNVKQSFKSFGLDTVIPALPSEQLILKFGSQEALLGNELCPYETIQYPYVSYEANPRSLYTLICINPDIGFSFNPLYEYDYSFLMYLLVNIRGEVVSSGDLVSGYKPALPLPGTGQNRNVCLVYRQPRTIELTPEFLIDIVPNVYTFNTTAFLRQNRLGSPIAGNLYLTRTTLCNTAPGGGSYDSAPGGGSYDSQNANNCGCNCCSA